MVQDTLACIDHSRLIAAASMAYRISLGSMAIRMVLGSTYYRSNPSIERPSQPKKSTRLIFPVVFSSKTPFFVNVLLDLITHFVTSWIDSSIIFPFATLFSMST